MSNQFEIILCRTSHLMYYYKMIFLNSYNQKTKNIKCRLNKFAHSNTKKEFHKAINHFRSWELYQEKKTPWVEGKKRQT